MGARRRTRRGSIWFWLFIAVVVILLLGIFFGGYRKGVRSLEIPGGTVVSVAQHEPTSR